MAKFNINGAKNTRGYKFKKVADGVSKTTYEDLEIFVEKRGRDWVATCGNVASVEGYKSVAVDSVILKIKGV